jgi:hypothetical protein
MPTGLTEDAGPSVVVAGGGNVGDDRFTLPSPLATFDHVNPSNVNCGPAAIVGKTVLLSWYTLRSYPFHAPSKLHNDGYEQPIAFDDVFFTPRSRGRW